MVYLKEYQFLLKNSFYLSLIKTIGDMCTILKGLVFLITVYRMISAFIEVIPITKQLMTFIKTLIL